MSTMLLSEDVRQAMLDRPCGHKTLHVIDRPLSVQTFDALAVAAGLNPIGNGWTEIDTDQAAAVLTSVLHKDLAYSAELMPLKRAAQLAEAFIGSCARGNPRFATNTDGIPNEGPIRAWTSLTEATFDCGLAIVSDLSSAIYWVEDED